MYEEVLGVRGGWMRPGNSLRASLERKGRERASGSTLETWPAGYICRGIKREC